MKYINNQMNNYNSNIQGQLVNMFEQYKSFLTQEQPVYKNPKEEEIIDQLYKDLDVVDDLDLEEDKLETHLNKLETIQEDEEEQEELTKFIDDFETQIITEEELPTVEEELSTVEEVEELPTVEEVEELPTVEEVEELPTVEETPSDLELDDLPTIESDIEIDIEDLSDIEIEEFSDDMEEECEYIFTRGKNKGNKCDKQVLKNNKCKKHCK